MLVALAGLVLTALEWSSLATSDAVGDIGAVAGSIAYAALGALIVRRAGNFVGWFMLAEGAANAVMITGSAYAIFGMKAHPGTLPAAAAAGALAEAVFVLVAIDLAALFLVFPTGRLPSPRWRPAALAGLVLTGLSLASFVVSTRRVALPAPGGISLVYPNPLAVRSLRPVTWLGTLSGLALLFPLLLGVALVSLALRYRRGDQRLRQQMKWLGLAIAGVLATQVVGGLAIAFGQAASRCSKCRTPSPRSWCGCRPAGHGDRDPAATAVRHRRHHQPRAAVHPAAGWVPRCTRPSCSASARSWATGVPLDRRRRRHRAGVPAAAPARQPGGQRPGVRRTGHALPGAARLQPPASPASSTWASPRTGWCRCLAGRASGSRRGSG